MAAGTVVAASDWSGWRGDGSGIAASATPPVRWDTSVNVTWRRPIPGQGNSSPVVRNGRLFLTSSTEDGRKRTVFCLDASDGHLMWQRTFDAAVVGTTEPKNGYASATCVTDGDSLYAFFDSPGLVAFDFDGNVRWQHELGPFKTAWGLASSPIAHQQLVFMACDQEKGAFITALDKTNGQERWRAKRDDRMQFSTPRVIQHHGEDQLVLNGETVTSYDPPTGRVRWTCRGMREASTPTAQYQDDLVWVTSGRNGPAMTIDPSASGDVTDTHVRMRVNSGGCYITSPITWHHGILLPSDDGHLRFVNAAGTVVAKIRVVGHFSASPVLAADRLYWSNEKGVTYVIDVSGLDGPAPALRTLAENDLGERILASPAVVDQRLYLRTDTALYCLSEMRTGAGAGIAAGSAATTRPAAPAGAGTPTLASLRDAYASHPGQHGPNVDARLDAVEAASHLSDAGVIPFLLEAARDPQWDVSTLAAKALAHIGAPAADALTDLLKATGGQGYLNTISADTLGDLHYVKAIPALIERSHLEWDASVRIASLRAIAKMIDAPDVDRDAMFVTLLKGLTDRDGAVREATIEALVVAAPFAGTHRADAIVAIDRCATDKNPRVVTAALKARETAYKMP